MNPNIEFDYAGLFSTQGKWIHPKRIEKTYEIIYVTQGEVFMREGDREIHASRGQLMLLSPNVCHFGTRHTTDVAFYWVHFTIHGGELPFAQRFFESFDNSYLFKELLHCNNLPKAPEYLVNSVLLHILSELSFASGENARKYDATAEKIYEWIRINADGGLKVEDAAKHFMYSPDHLTRVCKANYGIGARELINRFVIARAKELLCNSDKYVKEIAAELDFSDDKAFIGYFKYHEGLSPSEFRNRFGRIHMNSK